MHSDALAGLKRALARNAPEGYEQQSQWAGEYGPVADEQLMALYRRRQQDRIAAENAARSQRMQQTGIWEPSVQNSFNMGGFFEGTQYSDEDAGIDDAGDVVADAQVPRLNMRSLQLPRSTPSMRALRGLR